MTENEIVAETLKFIYDRHPSSVFVDDFLTDKYGKDFNYHAIVDRIEGEGLAECKDPRHIMRLTFLGRQVEKSGGYLELLEQREAEEKASKEENELERKHMRAQLRELEWHNKTRWWPHILSGIALLISIIVLLLSEEFRNLFK